ncbi:Isotrichodermin C-15 hydroxylase [Cyphellophora attinorum]|uniref:Isotrichodermin C-15 hydroxylase n=1 Tax=Cyphellophora attinorum TaxID=1664694 RepID=A0A0N0NHA6_9EURO|nr:Isotrichodermin C-15 hydroxylase [Phialophora attinorum]KPI34338.1 Isotrichodermin C-15 hydroxylase [Phialophora attinorum]
MSPLIDYVVFAGWIWIYVVATVVTIFLLKCIYNLSPLHPLHTYPGPRLWRASRIFASLHHARGDLYQQIARFHARHGPTVRIAPSELSFTDPAAWGTIYNSRPQLQKSKFHFGESGDRSKLPDSMIVATDSEHMRLRRLVSPAFLGSALMDVEPVLQRYSDLLCHTLETKRGQAVNMVEYFLWTLNDVIGQLALDTEFQCLEKERMHPWPSFLMKILKQTAFFNQLKRFGFSLKLLGPFLPKRVIEERDGFFSTAQNAVSERLAREDVESEKWQGNTTVQGSERPDIIGLMLREMKGRKGADHQDKMTEPEILSNSILIVGGGAETTSTCLSATLYHLCRTPRVMGRLQEELRGRFGSLEEITIKATADMAYLRATVDESLRIFPVASYINPRVVGKGGVVLDGNVVPEGTHVSMAQWYLGGSERFFDNPKEFRPERWLSESDEGGLRGGAHHVEGTDRHMMDEVLKPFSLGPRNCIGKLLAIAEARLVTAKLLWKFDIELDGPQDGWVDGARFYILWELEPLMVKLKAVR